MGNEYLNQLQPQKSFFMTQNGLDNLKTRLDTLIHDRAEAVKRIRLINDEDRDDSIALADEVRRLEANEIEVAKINNLLLYVKPVIKSKLPTEVQVGSEVVLKRGAKKISYTVVCPLEIDLEANKISEDSPLGCALLGKKLHDTMVVSTRKGGNRTYEIVGIQ